MVDRTRRVAQGAGDGDSASGKLRGVLPERLGQAERRTDADAGRCDDGVDTSACIRCGGPLTNRHCKVLCLNRGYVESCEDL